MNQKVAQMNVKLQALGYDCMMLFVNTSEEVAQDRNTMRAFKCTYKRNTQNVACSTTKHYEVPTIFGAANSQSLLITVAA